MRPKLPNNSLSIGLQPHINRLKRFFCDNIEKQNEELANKIQFVPGHFSSHLKSLISDRLNSAKGQKMPTLFGGFDNVPPFSSGEQRIAVGSSKLTQPELKPPLTIV